jgi:general secretion pathway protein F
MPIFSYKAADSTGKIIKGVLEASDDRAVAAQLDTMGYIPIRIRVSGSKSGIYQTNVLNFITPLLNRITGSDLMLFTQDLSTLLTAGLPVDKALSILIDITENPNLKKIIEDILKAVHGGTYLSDALGNHPRVFSKFYVNMVRAGEAGGVLEAVLSRLAIFLESSQELKDFIKSALVYPIFLVLVGGISIIILLTFVIPKFSIIFADLGATIPLSTRILLSLSDIIRGFWWLIILLLVAGGFLMRRYIQTPDGKKRLDRLKMDLPMLGTLTKNVETARFSRTLGTLIKSGVPILQSLALVKDIISNVVIAKSLDEIRERVKKGDRLSKPLARAGFFPSMAIQMITVGEETGKLDEMLLKVADNYEKVVRSMVKRMISFIEPAMILLMGLLVGFIIISMLLAIFSVNEIPF